MNSSEFTSAQQHSAVYAPFPRYYHLFMNDHMWQQMIFNSASVKFSYQSVFFILATRPLYAINSAMLDTGKFASQRYQ